MNYNINKSLPITLVCLLGLALFLSSCNADSDGVNKVAPKPIKRAEIIAFQEAYGISFNAISQAIENESYYETAAKKHIDQNYNFDEGKVMFKIGHNNDEPYRYTYDGILSYLIGKNKDFPKDKGIAKENWRKMKWKNDGIISDDSDVAVVMGVVTMIKDDVEELKQNFTMCLKRNSNGDLRLIAHKIALACR